MKLKLFFIILPVTILLVLFATAVFAQEEIPAPYVGIENPHRWADEKAQDAGRELYQKQCLGCHGADGGNLPTADFSTVEYQQQLEEKPDYAFWLLSDGRMDKGMPPYKSSLSEKQRWQILNYLWSLGPSVESTPKVPTVSPEPVAAVQPELTEAVNPFPWDDSVAHDEGQEIYQKQCLGCHGNNGEQLPKADLSTTDYAKKLEEKPEFYFRLLSEGVLEKGMPPYQNSLTDDQLWKVLTYLWSFGQTAKPAPGEVTNPPEVTPTTVPESPVEKHTPSEGTNPFNWDDTSAQEAGKLLFQKQCLICHGAAGNQIPYVNFNSLDFPKNLKETPEDYFKIVSDGISIKDMPAFQASLTNEKIWQILTYLGSFGHLIEPSSKEVPVEAEVQVPLQCLNCHNKILRGHDELGEGSEACWSCHLSTKMGVLHTASGAKEFPLSESTQLCKQCHQKRFKSWDEGEHGVPSWSNNRPASVFLEKTKCTECHNPHQPQMVFLGITKPHPDDVPPPSPLSRDLLIIVSLSVVLVSGVGIAVARKGEGP